MTRKQLILWNYLRTLVDITAIVPLYYQGVVAGSEFITYAGTKLYFCLEFNAGGIDNPAITQNSVQFYDRTNGLSFQCTFSKMDWNATGAAYNFIPEEYSIKNLYFSRIVQANFTRMKFIGYRLTY